MCLLFNRDVFIYLIIFQTSLPFFNDRPMIIISLRKNLYFTPVKKLYLPGKASTDITNCN